MTQGCLYVWLCPPLCSSVDCSPPDPSVHGIFEARILGWVAISYSRGSSWPRDWTVTSCVSCPGWQILYQLWSPRGHLGECNFSTSRRQGEDMGERSVLRRPHGVLFGYTRGESVSLPFHFQKPVILAHDLFPPCSNPPISLPRWSFIPILLWSCIHQTILICLPLPFLRVFFITLGGPTWIQHNFPHLKKLNRICKVPFAVQGGLFTGSRGGDLNIFWGHILPTTLLLSFIITILHNSSPS